MVATKKPYRVLSPTAILGYGFPPESFRRGMESHPDLIAVDAGSTDPGPYYLGAGKSFTSRGAVKRDLEFLLRGALDREIPCIIGSAGGAGAREHVQWTLSILREVAHERGFSFRLGVVYADVRPETVLEAMRERRVTPLEPAPEVSADEVRRSVRIVAQMGAEPVMEALRLGCRVVLCGRCYDPIPFAAPPIAQGYDAGLAVHMGKILECGAIAATPGSGKDCVLGILEEDSFVLQALNSQRRFTRMSAAAHTLYEKSDPYSLPGPGGTLDLRRTRFEELEGGKVRVSGSRFVPSPVYTVKLEGAKPMGFRTICVAGIRDPILIGRLDQVLGEIRDQVVRELGPSGVLLFRVYGRNGVMGELEPMKDRVPHEVGLIIEAVAPDQEAANGLCAYARSSLLHEGYPGRISTAGNLAFPYSPSDTPCGPVFEFSLYHLMSVRDPLELFPVEIEEIQG